MIYADHPILILEKYDITIIAIYTLFLFFSLPKSLADTLLPAFGKELEKVLSELLVLQYGDNVHVVC